MSRCDVCLRHVDVDLVCPHDDDRRLCSDCCGCDPDVGPTPGQLTTDGHEVIATGTTTIPRNTP